jgi:hypothetical protein
MLPTHVLLKISAVKATGLLMMRFVNAPQHLVQSFRCVLCPLGAVQSGRHRLAADQETIRKSEKDTRQYQAIRLDNGMVVLLVSDPQAVKSLSALVVPVGS